MWYLFLHDAPEHLTINMIFLTLPIKYPGFQTMTWWFVLVIVLDMQRKIVDIKYAIKAILGCGKTDLYYLMTLAQ